MFYSLCIALSSTKYINDNIMIFRFDYQHNYQYINSYNNYE